MHEQPPKIEKERPYIEKHNRWLQEVEIGAKSILGGVGGGLIGFAILKILIPEFNLPPHVMAGMLGGLSTVFYATHSRE